MKYWITAGVLFFIDMGSKWLAKIFLAQNPLPLFPQWIELKLAFNEGVALSLPIPRFFQIFFTLLFFLAFFLWAKKYFSEISKYEQWGSVLLLSGAVGNFWERVLFGKVTDFFSFSLPEIFSFPVFNFADIFIFIGVCLWIWGSFGEKQNTNYKTE